MNKSAVVIQATILVIVVAMSFQLWKLDTDLKVISSNQEQISPGHRGGPMGHCMGPLPYRRIQEGC